MNIPGGGGGGGSEPLYNSLYTYREGGPEPPRGVVALSLFITLCIITVRMVRNIPGVGVLSLFVTLCIHTGRVVRNVQEEIHGHIEVPGLPHHAPDRYSPVYLCIINNSN